MTVDGRGNSSDNESPWVRVVQVLGGGVLGDDNGAQCGTVLW